MLQSRRKFLRTMAGVSGLLLTGAAKSAPSRSTESMLAALGFLVGRQSPDGAWRSDQYGAFRAGDALTPVALWAMQTARLGLLSKSPFRRGLRWLERLTDSQRPLAEAACDLKYPLFTASYAAQVFAQAGDVRRAAVWAGVAGELRISSALGWPENDPSCGAWGDSPNPPRLPADTQPPPDMLAPNLSATVLGLRAFAGRDHHKVALRNSLPFIASCQNFASSQSSEFDDGGFFFAPSDSVRNKAGIAGGDAQGRVRFNSYGSATCDGFLALHFCGYTLSHPRMAAAAAWLKEHTDGIHHSGHWIAGRAGGRESLTFYYAQALAETLNALSTAPNFRTWSQAQRAKLASGLISRQREDGSWQGAAPNSCEDDPVLATAFGVRALGAITKNLHFV